MPIRTKSVIKDPKANLVTVEEELVEVISPATAFDVAKVRVKKTKRYQMKLSDYNPAGIYAARTKNFGDWT